MQISARPTVTFVFATLLLAAAPTAAQETFSCINPVAPLCMSMMDERISEEACVVEAGAYVESLEEYATCLEDSAEQARQESTRVRQNIDIEQDSQAEGDGAS